MYKVKSRPWPEIARFYRSMATEHGHEWLTPMVTLVEQIQAADYVGNVYGSTHLRLRISYLSEFDPDKEVLNVDFNRASGQFEFEYQETASPLYKRWKRKCPANDAFPVFNRFLQLKKWFPKVLINGVTAEVHFGEGTLPILAPRPCRRMPNTARMLNRLPVGTAPARL